MGAVCRGCRRCGRACAGSRDCGAVGQAGFELGEPVQALGGGVGDPGQDRAEDLVLPPGNRPGEADQLGDVVVAGAPVVEGEEPVPDVALTWRGAGDAGAQVQGGAEFFLGDPGGGDLLPGQVAAQDVRDLGELGG